MRMTGFVILLAVVLAFVFVTSSVIFKKLFVTVETEFAITATGAFLGAFFVYLFVRIADFSKAHLARIQLNHNSLVRLERYLYELLDAVDKQIFYTEDFHKTFNTSRGEAIIPMWANKLRRLPIEKEPLFNLSNIDLINESYGLFGDVERINESMETINTRYTEAAAALRNNAIDPQTYLTNVYRIKDQLPEVRKSLDTSIVDVKKNTFCCPYLA